MTWYPEAGDIVAIFENLRASMEGKDLTPDDGLMDLGGLEGIIDRVKFGLPMHEETDLFLRAAILIRDITLDDFFTNGNKRVAFLAMYLFLEKNGFQWQCNTDLDEEFVLEIAKGNLTDLELITNIIRERARSADEE